MNYYFQAKKRSPTPPRLHPLLLSLTDAYNESDKSPDISSVSEDDPRALRSNYYTSPGDLPPLDIHFSGKNGTATPSDARGSSLTSAASCRVCAASEPQGNSASVGDATMAMPLAASSLEPMASEPQDNSEEVGDTTITMPSRGKKRRRASSSGLRSESFTFIAPMY